jgi:hypothetical protein
MTTLTTAVTKANVSSKSALGPVSVLEDVTFDGPSETTDRNEHDVFVFDCR